MVTGHRREFLARLFKSLDEQGVRYCVVRNYQQIYEEGDSDVDLAAQAEDLPRFEQCLAVAARATGFRRVLTGRYICFSYALRHRDGQFLRVDVQTEVRWRICPVLTAGELLGERRKCGEFFVPSPLHESIIVYLAAIWRGYLSDRYRNRLRELHEQLPSSADSGKRFREAFGGFGETMAGFQARATGATFDAAFWGKARRSLFRKAVSSPRNLKQCVCYLVHDARRILSRLIKPTGISILQVSSAKPPRRPEEFYERIEFLYPSAKSVARTFDWVGKAGEGLTKPPGAGWKRIYTLFKGGLFVRAINVSADTAVSRILRQPARTCYSSRDFVCAESSGRTVWLGHPESGYMAECRPPKEGRVSNQSLIQFIARILERTEPTAGSAKGRRGVFAVLVGLDGSGKTTVARQICCLGPEQGRFDRIRYFHWQPRVFGGGSFPLPEFRDVPRKQPPRSGSLQQVLSALRLGKNVALSRLAYGLRLRRLLRRNTLILVDRYYYNYYLDPVSVRYSGPQEWVDRARRWFPRPDVVIVLKGQPEVLLARKQELSREEMGRQITRLDRIDFNVPHRIDVDVNQAPEVIAEEILGKLARLHTGALE